MYITLINMEKYNFIANLVDVDKYNLIKHFNKTRINQKLS